MKHLILSTTLAIAACCAPLAAAEGLAGVWNGEYHYTGKREGVEAVHFSLVARHDPRSALFEGHVQEPNTFGDQKDVALEADVRGFVEDDGTVRFVKVYDGHGDQHHAIWYTGKLSDDRKSVTGKWYMSDSWGGEFTLTLVGEH